VIFESDCNLSRIDRNAFCQSGLKSIQIPMKVEFIGDYYGAILSPWDENLKSLPEHSNVQVYMIVKFTFQAISISIKFHFLSR
jgi:hypothetical protein